MPADQDYRSIVKRAGWMALALAGMDVIVFIYAFVHKVGASGFGIFGLYLGPMLMRGNLSTAMFVRKGATFYLVAGVSGLLLYLAFATFGAWNLDLIDHWAVNLAGLAYAIAGLALLFLIVTDLSREPVLQAARAAGEKPSNLLWPALIGIVLVFGLGIAAAFNPNPVGNAPASSQQPG